MKPLRDSLEVTTGLAIFSMLFGAGNLLAPLLVGIATGSAHIVPGIFPFLLTAVFLPLCGLVAIILFDGDYYAFFNRLGTIPGKIALFICMFVMGPLVAMPRLITTTYIMLEPVLPTVPLFLFSIFFVCATFVCTVQENKIIDLLGTFVSPLLLISLSIIIIKGILLHPPHLPVQPSPAVWFYNLQTGYLTLDLLASIFFASMVLMMLKEQISDSVNTKTIAYICLNAGFIGFALLTLIYFGLCYLGAYYGAHISFSNPAELFCLLAFNLFDTWAAFIMSVCIFLACFSTMIALTALTATYFHHLIDDKSVTHPQVLCMVLGTTAFISNIGLNTLLSFSQPIILICYPSLMVMTILNIFYKLWGIQLITTPVMFTFVSTLFYYFLW